MQANDYLDIVRATYENRKSTVQITVENDDAFTVTEIAVNVARAGITYNYPIRIQTVGNTVYVHRTIKSKRTYPATIVGSSKIPNPFAKSPIERITAKNWIRCRDNAKF